MNTGPLLLAAFVSPALFAGGAAMVAAPILIHLLARRRFKRIRWAAMEFLVDAERRNRRRIQMEEWILLALRCLAVLLIAAIVSRPFVQPGAMASALGGLRQTERVFVLDDSYSMAYRGDEATIFERAKTAIGRILKTVRTESPDDTVTILRMSDVNSPVESGTFLNEGQVDDVVARLAGLTSTNRVIEPPAVMAGVAEYLERSESIVSAAVYFVSDFQKSDWATAGPSPGAGNGGCFAPLAAWAGEDRSLRITCVNVADKDATNLAITKVGLAQGRLVAGAAGRVVVTLVHHADSEAQGPTVSIQLGQGLPKTEQVPTLPPGLAITSTLDVAFVRPGQTPMTVSVPEDRLPLDNTRYHVAEVAGAIEVLVVNGEPFADILRDETSFLTTALRPEGDVFSGHECEVVDEGELEAITFSRFHVVILANVYRVSESVIEKLERFVRRGGGLIFLLGDQVDADGYNTSLYRDRRGLLPIRLGEVMRPPSPTHLVIVDALHPITRGLARGGDPLGIATIPFFRFFSCQIDDTESDTDADTAPNLSGSDDPDADATESDGKGGLRAASRVRVLARFMDEDESPAILESTFGAGHVVTVTTAMDKEWGLWPNHPSYLPLVSEMVRFVARGPSGSGAHWVGAPLEWPIDPALYQTDAIVRTPSFPAEREYNVTAGPADNGDGLAIAWSHTDEPGIYEFLLQRRDGMQEFQRIAVNPDPGEGDLTSCGRADIVRAAGDVPFTYIDGLSALQANVDAGRTELWRVMLFSAVLVLMMEQGLAWWFGSRR